MKTLTLIFLVISCVCYGQQTKISADQIHDNAFRPVNSGALSGTVLTFDRAYKQYTLDVDADIALTLNGSGNVANSKIDIIATGDGSHLLTFPTDWKMRGDAYDVNSVNEIQLRYNGAGVIGEIINQSAIDVVETELLSAIITNEVPTQLNLTFNEPVIITDVGWTIDASAAAAVLEVVSGSGTTSVVFNLSRAILHSETVTVSYGGGIEGTTTDLAGFELADIIDFPVTVPDPPQSPVEVFDLYVDDDAADDVAAGTIGDPYKTISAAENAASPGFKIGIRTGTYRETVVVDRNDVTFKVYPGETAIINGFTVIPNTGWTVHSGNIYKKTITLPVNGFNTSTSPVTVSNTTLFANQILRNGDMMFQARFPNVDSFDDLMRWESYRQYSWTQGFKASALTDASIPGTPSALVGATIVSNGWYDTFASTITAHDNGGAGGVERVTYSPAIRTDTDPGQWMRQAYYIINDLDLLDAEQEWHYDGTTLYFWQPGGGSPSGTVEHKARNWGFDIRGRSGIKIIGLTFIGVDPVYGNSASTNAVIERTTATFNNHVVRHDYFRWNGVQIGMAYQLGTKLLGANSVFKDNVWSKAGSILLWLGPNAVVENNLLHDSGYAGNSGGAISLWEQDGGQIITRNTIYNQGRGALFFGYVGHGNHLNMEISYNHFYDYGTINSDGGASYAGNQTVTTGLNYHHNWIHGHQSRSTPGFGGLNGGIYFDQASGGGTIHHNVIWDNLSGDIYHQQRYNAVTSNLFNIYNNTLASTGAYGGNEHSYKTPDNTPLDVQRNNIYVRRILINWEAGNVGNNQNYIYQYTGTNPLFVGSGGLGLDYRIQTTSPAKNTGIVISGITDGSVGVPDIGAYEFGGEDWVPGYTAPLSDGTVDDDEWSYSLNWTEDNTALQIMNNQDVHYTLTEGSTATFQFTNSKADFYYEACNTHGVARFEVLNASAVVLATADVNTYSAVDCSVGTRQTHSFTGLAAGTKTARVTFFADDLGQTPPRNSFVFDGAKFFD